MKSDEEIARRIRDLRVQRGETQEEFARALQAGRSQVSEYETGAVLPSAEMFIRLARISPYQDCRFFYGCAGLAPSQTTQVEQSTAAMVSLVKKFDPVRGKTLESEILRLSADERFDRACEVVEQLQPRKVPPVALRDEDRALLDETARAVAEFRKKIEEDLKK